MDLMTSKGYVRRWELVNGQPECTVDAVPPSDPNAAEYMRHSQAVLELSAEADAVTQAMRATPPENGEPRTIAAIDSETGEAMFDDDGNVIMQDNPDWTILPRLIGDKLNPAWAPYDAAIEVVKSASDAALALIKLRADPEDAEAGKVVSAYIAARAAEIAPALPVPESIALWQARAALAAAGLLEGAQAAIEKAGPVVAAAWEYGNTISRSSPTIAALGAALGLDERSIDNLFRQAAEIKV